jgi:hypothetical protein
MKKDGSQLETILKKGIVLSSIVMLV